MIIYEKEIMGTEINNMKIGDEISIRIRDLYDYVNCEDGEFSILTPGGFENIGDVYKKSNKSIYEVELENGFKLKGSSDHLVILNTENQTDSEVNENIEILDNNFWIRLGNITNEDYVETTDGVFKVKSITFIGLGDTYDLEVMSTQHSYISNGIHSHNTGKSSIAEGLALRIIERKCSRILFDKRVVMLDLAAMVAGTKYRGQFEERVKALMNEVEQNPDVILFIDEIHTMVGAGGSSGSLDASNMLKPALARGEIQIIGATTLDEYRKHIEKDGALARRFQKVMVEAATPEETIEILHNIKDKYEKHHQVTYSDESIKACVELTNRYIPDRFLPDKAIDALDEVGARVHISTIVVPKEIIELEKKIIDIREKKTNVIKSQKYEEAATLRDVEKQFQTQLDVEKDKWHEISEHLRQPVEESDVSEVVSVMSGIPLNKVNADENEKLATMQEALVGTVIGQDEAVQKVVKAIQRSRVGLKDPNKPIFTGILIGNSGVGKTELAKQLARYMFDSEDSLLRLDMSEFMEKISITRIQGAAPGYVGYDDGSFLDKVRTKPYSVILLDEIEKAHTDIFNLFLQVFDDGHMTDSHGRKVSFKNVVILMTSNVGTKKLRDFGNGIGFNTKYNEDSLDDNMKSTLGKELKNKFPPEFVNRLDDIIYFNDLKKTDILKIVEIELNKTINRANVIGYDIQLTDNMKSHLVDVGYSKEYGARPLKRAIQKYVDDEVTDYIIKNPKKDKNIIKLKLDYNSEKSKIILTKSKQNRKIKGN